MNTSEIFDGLLANLKVDNNETIAARRDEIVKVLNKEFRGLGGSTDNKLMVGSYGRFTAIRGISDLDLLFIMPPSRWADYKDENGPASVLAQARSVIQARYPSTSVKVDRLVVVVKFGTFMFEVQPVFEQEDGSFKYPDTYANSWKVTKPRDEIKETSTYDDITNGNLRRLCKMVRAWKNKHGVVMGGLLLDTLAHNFFQKTTDHDSATTATFDRMIRDFFLFLSEEEDHDHYQALGSNQDVKVKKKFQRKAKTAYELCLKAIDAQGTVAVNDKWKKIFGRSIPNAENAKEAASAYSFSDTEEFIEDLFPVDVRYSVAVDCTVTQDGFRADTLRHMLARRVWLRPKKTLDFMVTECEVAEPFVIKWKVLNRGDEAERRNEIRGRIIHSNSKTHRECTKFRGEHYVECYVLKDGVLVARDHVEVPIATQ